MEKTLISAFKFTNKNLIIPVQFVMVHTLSNILLSALIFVGQKNIFSLIAVLGLGLSIVVALFTGWYSLIYKTISKSIDEDKKNTNFFADFFSGVGSFFTHNIYLGFISIVVFILALAISHYLLVQIFPSLNISLDAFKESWQSIMQIDNVTPQLLSKNDYAFLFLMGLFGVASWFFLYFLTITQAVMLFDNSKNPLITILNSMKYIVKNFLNFILLLCILSVLYFIFLFLSRIFIMNPYLMIIGIFAFAYFMSFYTITIFLNYANKTQ